MNGKELLSFIMLALIIGGLMTYVNTILTNMGASTNPFSDNPFSNYASGVDTNDLGLDVGGAGVNVESTGFFSLLENLNEVMSLFSENQWLNFIMNAPFFIKGLLVALGLDSTIAFIINVILLVVFVFLFISWVFGR